MDLLVQVMCTRMPFEPAKDVVPTREDSWKFGGWEVRGGEHRNHCYEVVG